MELRHTTPWVPSTGSYEDEYLVGLDSIIEIFSEVSL
jgi:hypothetical protein